MHRSGSRELLPRTYVMTFTTDDTCMVKTEYSNEEISAVLNESRQERKRLRKLSKVMETVAAYRLKKLKHFQALENLATWRRTYGYDRDDSWMYGTRPLAPEEFTASLWEEVNALKEAISMSGRARPRQKTKKYLDGLEQGIMSLTDEELVMLKRIVEKRYRDAAHVTVAPADTAQYRSPRSRTPEIPSDVCVGMEKKKEGRMNPEPTELESPSTGTGLETPEQQSPPNGETGRTTADGCCLGGVGSSAGGNICFPAEIAVRTRPDSKSTTPPAASNTIFLQARRKPNDKKTLSEENKQSDPGGKGGEPPPWNAGCTNNLFFFWERRWAWDARCLCFVCFCVFLYVCA